MQFPVSSIITVVVVCLLGALLAAAQRGVPKHDQTAGAAVFRYSDLFRAVAVILAIGITVMFTFLFASRPPAETTGWLNYVPTYLFFVLLGGLMVWETARFRLTLTDTSLECFSPWRGRKTIHWTDVTEIYFNPSAQWFVVRSRDGSSFRVSLYIAGIHSFLEKCEQRLPARVLAKAKPAYGILRRQFPRGLS